MKPDKHLREEYLSRINRVLDYIEAHMDQKLTLDELAEVSMFSRFHFHRIFRAMTGETLNQYIQRIRLERAASKLLANPKHTITEIALDCGFSGSAVFARAFKEMYQMSASDWRASGKYAGSKICKKDGNGNQTKPNIGKDSYSSSFYIDNTTNNLRWRIIMKDNQEINVEVKEMPDYPVAYVRHTGPYKGDTALFKGLFDKLMKWAAPRGLLQFPETKVLCVSHDDPNITDEDKLRISACITVPENTSGEGEIGTMTVPGGQFAVARFELKSDEFEEAWNMLCGQWLPNSGYQPDDRLCYEMCLNDYREHPEQKHIVDICIPVKPL